MKKIRCETCRFWKESVYGLGFCSKQKIQAVANEWCSQHEEIVVPDLTSNEVKK